MPDECLCGGKKLYMDDGRKEYVWCACVRQEQDDVWALHCLMDCGIQPYILETVTFDTWIPSFNDGCNYAMSTALKYATDEVRTPWLFLSGQRGLGKTHLLIAAAGMMAQRGIEVVYYSAPELALDLREAEGRFEAAPLIRKLSQIRVLALDDLGAEHATAYSDSAFHQILDKRYHERKRTILSTNEPLHKFPDRLKSRITDVRTVEVLELEGTDVRPRLDANQ